MGKMPLPVLILPPELHGIKKRNVEGIGDAPHLFKP